jgi:hypothetical protein
LRVADVRSRDAGTLESWALVIQFAGDAPKLERPRAARTQMIPVVAHLFGIGSAAWRSDLTVANVTATPQLATLIFTRSGEDGTTDFSAFDVPLAPGQTAFFEDLVAAGFFTAGSGSLEVLGDVLVSSRLYTTLPNGGKVGQEVPASLPSIEAPSIAWLHAVGLADRRATRWNAGITETSGVRTRVRIGPTLETGTEITLEPFSHVQVSASETVYARLIEGGRITLYLSQVDPETGDAMFLPADVFPAHATSAVVPAIRAPGANGSFWTTDLWVEATVPWDLVSFTYHGVLRIPYSGDHLDYLQTIVAGPTAGALTIVDHLPDSYLGARITHGAMNQFIRPMAVGERREEHLIGVENGGSLRTNIGIVSDAEATAEVLVFDAAGNEVERHLLATAFGLAQTAVARPVTGGRALVRVLSGRARAWASVIDDRSGDAAFVEGL